MKKDLRKTLIIFNQKKRGPKYYKQLINKFSMYFFQEEKKRSGGLLKKKKEKKKEAYFTS